MRAELRTAPGAYPCLTAAGPSGALDGAHGVAITTDGAHAYIAATNAVSHFTIDAAGSLIYAGCIGDTSGCTPVTKGALGGGWALAVTNDGTQLYAAALRGDAVSHFTIAGFTSASRPSGKG